MSSESNDPTEQLQELARQKSDGWVSTEEQQETPSHDVYDASDDEPSVVEQPELDDGIEFEQTEYES